jgi:nucleoid-associated protein YgaU
MIMDREQGVGMLLALVFIVAFGMILHELGGSDAPPANAGETIVSKDYHHPMATPQKAMPIGPNGVFPNESRRTVAPLLRGLSRDEILLRHVARNATTIHRTVPASAPVPARTSTTPVNTTAQRTYIVQPNDTLVSIAQKMYGANNGREYRRIVYANQGNLGPNGVMYTGQTLRIPRLPSSQTDSAIASLERSIASRSRRAVRYKTYVVQNGDSLRKIVREKMNGSETDLTKLISVNRTELPNPNLLRPGMRLRIPS